MHRLSGAPPEAQVSTEAAPAEDFVIASGLQPDEGSAVRRCGNWRRWRKAGSSTSLRFSRDDNVRTDMVRLV